MVGVSKVDKNFDNGTDLADDQSSGFKPFKKRKLNLGEPIAVPPSTEENTRHNAWIHRGDAAVKPSAWRPVLYSRVVGKRAVAELDNAIRQGTPLPGLSNWKRSDAACWKDWRLYPHLNVGNDCGSDVLTMNFAVEYHYKLNVTCWRDWDHGAQRSLIEMLKVCSLFEFMLLMMVCWNLASGPHNNDLRWSQIKDACDKLGRTHTHTHPSQYAVVPREGRQDASGVARSQY